jgi:REP element-mobilizing transposase RayT
MVRGLERRIIFRDDADRTDFVARLATLATRGALTIYAWALLPNHAHLLLRTGARPLARSMRSLLTGYAGAFNRRHHRTGHLFQNRYKSIVVEEEPYLLELVRYLHLNPLRAQVVLDLRALDRYPWSGHTALLGTAARPWQATQEILDRFGSRLPQARRAYRLFVAAGIPQGHQPAFQGGGLLRSQGGWAAVAALRRGREAYQADERILGSSAFVEAVRQALQAASPPPARRRPLAELIARVCAATGGHPGALRQGSRRPALARAREGIAYIAVEVEGYSGRAVAEALGVRPPSVYKAAARGSVARSRWDRVFGR